MHYICTAQCLCVWMLCWYVIYCCRVYYSTSMMTPSQRPHIVNFYVHIRSSYDEYYMLVALIRSADLRDTLIPRPFGSRRCHQMLGWSLSLCCKCVSLCPAAAAAKKMGPATLASTKTTNVSLCGILWDGDGRT